MQETRQWSDIDGYREATRSAYRKFSGARSWNPKLHDILDPSDPGEPLDMNQTPWTPKFRQGNRRFLTKRLWGAANEPPFFHHGLFTTLRQSILAHSGEALQSRREFEHSSEYDQDSLIEFLKTLQVLPPETRHVIVDEHFREKPWPPRSSLAGSHAEMCSDKPACVFP